MNGDFYERALRRVQIFAVAVGLAGALAFLAVQGLRPATGFLMGAALSVLNFRGLAMLAGAIGGSKRPGAIAAVLIALRYLLIGGAIYVMIKFLEVTPLAVLWGLLAAFAAVILEILYELIFRVHE